MVLISTLFTKKRLLKYPLSERFPPQFAEFFIKFLTDEGDVTLDPFASSNVYRGS